MPIEVCFPVKDFRRAVKNLLAPKPRRGQARVDYVDFNVRQGEVQLVTTGTLSSFSAEIKRGGYARIPYTTFRLLSRSLLTLSQSRVAVSIQEGEVRAAGLAFRHHGITIRQIGARIADLPVNASLLDALMLMAQFSGDELEDSGLLGRVMEAQAQATVLIDQAAKILESFGIERETLREFVWDQVRRRAHESKPPLGP